MKLLKFYENINWCSLKFELKGKDKVEIALFNFEFRGKGATLKRNIISKLRIESLKTRNPSNLSIYEKGM